MKSLTKSKMSQEQIGELVCACFGDTMELLSVSEQGGGMFTTAYVLSLKNKPEDTQSELVLRVSVSDDEALVSYEKFAVRTEADVNRKLHEKGIPVPAIVKTDFSRQLIDRDYFFMTKLNGVTWFQMNNTLSFEDKQKLKTQLGQHAAVIHSVKNDSFGYPFSGSMYGHWREAFLSMLGDVIRDARKKRLKLPYKDIMAAIKDKAGLLDEIKEPCLVDFDLWAGNILLTGRSGAYAIEGLIDFERAFYGDPYADFVSAMMIFDDVERELAFIKGYEEKSGRKLTFTDNDRTRILMYRIYLTLVTALEISRYPRGFSQYLRAACLHQITTDLAALQVR